METHKLTNDNISSDMKRLSEYYKRKKIDKTVTLQNTFVLEDILLSYQKRFGEDKDYTLSVYHKRGTHIARVSVKGEPFDPMSDGEEDNYYLTRLLRNTGLAPAYRYHKGINMVSVQDQTRKMSSITVLLITVVISIICALIARLLPDDVSLFIKDEIVSPIANTFTGLLSAFIGPCVFFSLLNSMISLGDISGIKQMSGRFFRTIFSAYIIIYLISVFGLLPFIKLGEGGQSEAPFTIIRDTLLSIIPVNLVTPFSTNSILQILFVGLIIALAILKVGDQESGVAGAIVSINNAFGYILQKITSLLPVFIFLSIYLFVSDSSLSLDGSEYLVIFFLVGEGIIVLLYCVAVRIWGKVTPKTLFSYSLSTIIKATLCASSMLVLPEVMKDMADKNKYNLDEKEVQFISPLTMILFKPASAMGYFSVILAIMKISGTNISLSMLTVFGLLCMIFAIASPATAGSGIGITILLFEILNLKIEYLALALTMTSLFDFPLSGLNCMSVISGTVICGRKKLAREE